MKSGKPPRTPIIAKLAAAWLEKLEAESSNDHISWKLLPAQERAASSEAFETLYGGAGGGGKSALLLILATTKHRRSIIFRRQYPNLKELIEKSRELIGTVARYNSNDKLWRGIPGDRQLEFGAMQRLEDRENFRGRAHDLKAFDELGEFLEDQYTFVIGWTRSTIPDQRCRVIATCNPPSNESGRWIIKRWAPWLDPTYPNPALPGELRWFAMIDGKDTEVESGEPFEHKGETIYPKSRTFLPAKLSDNPYLKDSGYAAVLQSMPEPLRSQMLYGDFSIQPDSDPWQVIPVEWVKLAQKRWSEDGVVSKRLTAIGCDVARGGKDKTVLAKRYGNWFAPLIKQPGKATPDGQSVAALIVSEMDYGAYTNIDIIGVGGSVYDHTQGTGWADDCIPVNFGERSDATDKTGKLQLTNIRAEAWWKFREALDPDSGEDIALPDDPEILSDLCAPKWFLTAQGIRVERKEEIIKRLGRSPDCGDAIVLSWLKKKTTPNDWY